MTDDLGLDSLLSALRDAGLRVGFTEVARLRRVFAAAPRFAEDGTARRLKSLLRAAIAKSRRDCETVDRVCDIWLERPPAEDKLTADRHPKRPRRRPPRSARRRRLLNGAKVTAGVMALLGLLWLMPPPPPAPPPATPPPPAEDAVIELPTPAEMRQKQVPGWVVTFEDEPLPQVEWAGKPATVAAVLAVLAALGLWLALYRRRWLPAAAPAPGRGGPPRAFPQPPPLRGPQLLERRDQETLVWGIGKFTAEEPTRRLDLAATVRATARAAGLVQPRFEHARYQREVWLWVDETAADPLLARAAAEVAATLRAYGLEAEEACFRGFPEHLVTADGRAFAPREIAERRAAAVVAVLTDGRVLCRQHGIDRRRVRVAALLRLLSHWPRLAFVDFSDGAGDLRRILEHHGLEVVAPDDLAAFLGAGTRGGPGYRDREDAAWAAACALSPAPVAEATAFALRRRLALTTTPWALRALRAEAPGPGGRLSWGQRQRARRVDWLAAAEGEPAAGVAGLLAGALDFWDELYETELGRRPQDAKAPEGEAPARRHLRMERALLRLWRHPGEATRELYRLCFGLLGDTIRRQLAQLAPRGRGSDHHVHLPWRWQQRSAVEQQMLLEMGLGGGMPGAGLRRPGRMWVGVGLCLGLAAGALALAPRLEAPLPLAPQIEHRDGPPAAAEVALEETTEGSELRVTVDDRRYPHPLTAGSKTIVQWRSAPRPCVETLDDGTELWRCGRTPPPPRLSNDIDSSVVVLGATPGTAEIDELAVALVYSGSADRVLVRTARSNDLDATLKHLPAFDPRAGQLVLLTSSDAEQAGEPQEGRVARVRTASWSALGDALRFEGVRTLADAWPGVEVVAGDADRILLRGLGGCQPGQELVEDGFTWVRICPGTFLMGSPKTEVGRWDDEGPVHEVRITAEFWIAQTETTNKQYRLVDLDHQGPDLLPVVNVTWNEANDFCTSLGHRLPTEAEWEYAARAGTQTRWSFGDDESQLGAYAWYRSNSGGEPRPVGEKDPNLWGLHDMHGNAWEWTADDLGDYSAESQVDPLGAGPYRALRGGSFAYGPRFLRSAFRYGVEPEFRIRNYGFRCVRAPHRQP